MTRHLTDSRLVEIAEGRDSHPHLIECERCRAQVEDLRALMKAVGEVVVPEPSPLFWKHFAARVAARVQDEERAPARTLSAWRHAASWRRMALVAAALLVIAIVSRRSGVLAPAPEHLSPAAPGQVALLDAPAGAKAMADESDDDETWALVIGAASELDLEAATGAGFDLQPGSAEAAAAQLSPDEQRELVRLLQSAVAQPN